MNNESDIVYFELNNWFRGKHYPDDEPFITWFSSDLQITFNDEEWVVQNQLCVVCNIIDMSINFCITATREWVKRNCPKLLTEYKKFIRYPDEEGCVYGQFGDKFLEYSEENFGIKEVYEEN